MQPFKYESEESGNDNGKKHQIAALPVSYTHLTLPTIA